ncbi:MAG TPA: hypothetical protein PLP17_04315, partial [Oligoflexia bacterium]|nr:hypothetical protein [Oligoflexia bacterium]
LDLQHYPAQLAGFTVMLKAVRKIIAAKLRSPAFSLTLAQAAEQYCTTHCLHGEHFQEIAPQDRDKYRLLSAKVLVGQRVCEKRDGCRLLSFAQHLSDSGSELAHTPLRDIFAPVAAAGWLSAFDSQLDNSSRFIALIKEAVMTYCVKYCTHSKKGIEFTEGDVFLSEWTDLMKNSCDYCPERNCPVSDFMRIFISRIVGIERSAP